MVPHENDENGAAETTITQARWVMVVTGRHFMPCVKANLQEYGPALAAAYHLTHNADASDRKWSLILFACNGLRMSAGAVPSSKGPEEVVPQASVCVSEMVSQATRSLPVHQWVSSGKAGEIQS